MQKLRSALYAFLLAISCTFVLDRSASAVTETTLHAFTDGSDGGAPDAGLISDSNGNLYGTAFEGGAYGYGSVYKLTHSASGWTETVLYNFHGGTGDGASPDYDLAFDATGNLYGTTSEGGIDWNNPAVRGWGTVFELTPSGSEWTERVIHFFVSGFRPSSGLILNKAGDIFGETGGTGMAAGGSIYEMKNESTGWKFGTLLTFDGTDEGNYPNGGLILDGAGNLYGTTNSEGALCCGTVFEVKHGANDTWTRSLLYSFSGGTDGGFPQAPLVSNGPGKLYGTTMTGGDLSCGSGGCGVVFELSLSGGIWTETVLHSFTDSPDGNNSQAGMTFDKAGNLFGTTLVGGADGYGSVFELMPQSGGEWEETILYSFTNGNDGAYPSNALLRRLGNIYSTANGGGQFGWGVVFELPGAGQ
jgi:uncharacterized repeat protein (TIGR03803 family)